MYYYVYNLQGDVTHIIDATGAIKGTYQYDAWGKILNLGSLTAIAQANPFRYRGYYYDTESGLYYLNSRYYNAEWGRFINADSYITTGQGVTGYNMFTYCGNSPINNVDPNGTCYYNANGVWCHDNWEYLGGYVRQPDPNIVAAQADKNTENIDKALTAIQSIYTTLIDDMLSPVISSMIPKSALNSAHALRALGYISDSSGIASAAIAILQIVWDYETYANDIKSFAIATGITVLSTAASVGLSAAIVASGITLGPGLVVALIGGLGISFAEDKLRECLLE